MTNEIQLKIAKTTDGDLVRSVLEVVRRCEFISEIKVNPLLGAIFAVTREGCEEELRKYLPRKGRTIVAIRLVSGLDELARISRDLGDAEQSSFDQVEITVPKRRDSPLTDDDLSLLLESLQTQLSTSVSANVTAMLGADVAEHLRTIEHALARVESHVDESLVKLENHRLESERCFQERIVKVAQEHTRSQEVLEQNYARKLKALEERESRIETREELLDARSNEQARRDDRKQLLAEVNRSDRFKISWPTSRRRYAVLFGYVCLLAFLATPLATWYLQNFGAPNEEPAPDAGSWELAQRIGFSLGFVVVAVFLLRWLSLFAQRSTEEEFKIKQLELDVIRANWLVELYFESRSTGGEKEIPDELIERLSRDLFVQETDRAESITTADALGAGRLPSSTSASLSR